MQIEASYRTAYVINPYVRSKKWRNPNIMRSFFTKIVKALVLGFIIK